MKIIHKKEVLFGYYNVPNNYFNTWYSLDNRNIYRFPTIFKYIIMYEDKKS